MFVKYFLWELWKMVFRGAARGLLEARELLEETRGSSETRGLSPLSASSLSNPLVYFFIKTDEAIGWNF